MSVCVLRASVWSKCVKSTDLDCLGALNGSFTISLPYRKLFFCITDADRRTPFINNMSSLFPHRKDQSNAFICNKIYLLITKYFNITEKTTKSSLEFNSGKLDVENDLNIYHGRVGKKMNRPTRLRWIKSSRKIELVCLKLWKIMAISKWEMSICRNLSCKHNTMLQYWIVSKCWDAVTLKWHISEFNMHLAYFADDFTEWKDKSQ